MAAYGALASLMHTLHQIEHHPLPPIYLDKEHLQSLTKNITFLQEFLETYPLTGNSEERYRFESRIAGAAYMAENIVESHVVDQIQYGNYGENIISVEFYRGLQRAIEDLDLIKKEAVEMKVNMGVRHQLQRISSMAAAAGSSGSSSTVKNTSMVGFDDVLLEILEKLTRGKPERQIISIVGMGGIGKTTLARNTYMHPLIKYHFDICAWVTISQEFDAQKIVKEILRGEKLDSADSSEKNEHKIGGDVLYKYLFGRRYLIIMDDMWSIEAWDTIKFFFPDCNNGSRIVVTTRLSHLARQLSNNFVIDIKFLDEDKSWDMFSKIVFEEEGCPPELEGIGKQIVRSCQGLPLSIVVIGGILARSGFEREYWEHIEENLNSLILMNSENNEQCSKILEMSYNQLPVHLKPCFLYLGVYGEDALIDVSVLVMQWTAEGFIRAVSEKTLEEVGEEYVRDLVDRNLIFVHKLRYTRKKIKYVKIHDLLRDFCLRQGEKERFFNVVSQHCVGIPQDIHSQRCMFIHGAILEDNVQHTLLSMPLTRSLMCDLGQELVPSPHHRLLRIFIASNAELVFYDCRYLENQLVNLRFVLVGKIPRNPISASPLHLLWNLQTLIIMGKFDEVGFTAPVEFWNMPHLRHVIVKPYLYLSDPPCCNLNREDEIVLANLQTLTYVRNFKGGQEVVKRIPNVKKLTVKEMERDDGCSDFDLSNLDQLHKLESFICLCDVPVNINFPHSLKKLSLNMAYDLHWEDMLEKIGSLPLLQKLILWRGLFRKRTWETVEGQFPNLKVLKLCQCDNLSCWTSESSHFPRLERLVLDQLIRLNEIPSGIGEIQTLQSIALKFCRQSLVISAKRMQEEQEELYGDEVALRVRVELSPEAYEEMRGLAAPNFELCT